MSNTVSLLEKACRQTERLVVRYNGLSSNVTGIHYIRQDVTTEQGVMETATRKDVEQGGQNVAKGHNIRLLVTEEQGIRDRKSPTKHVHGYQNKRLSVAITHACNLVDGRKRPEQGVKTRNEKHGFSVDPGVLRRIKTCHFSWLRSYKSLCHNDLKIIEKSSKRPVHRAVHTVELVRRAGQVADRNQPPPAPE